MTNDLDPANKPKTKIYDLKNKDGQTVGSITEVKQEGWEEVYGVLENTVNKIDKELRKTNMQMIESINLRMEEIVTKKLGYQPEVALVRQQVAVRELLELRKAVMASLELRLESQQARGRAQR